MVGQNINNSNKKTNLDRLNNNGLDVTEEDSVIILRKFSHKTHVYNIEEIKS